MTTLPLSQDTISAVLAALQVFSGQPNKASIDAANQWLQEFQHTVSVISLSAESRSKPSRIAASMDNIKLFTIFARLAIERKDIRRPNISRQGMHIVLRMTVEVH